MENEHWFWVAVCGVDGCARVHAFKHIGPKSAWDGQSPIDIFFPAEPIRVKCDRCQQVRGYDMEDMRPLLGPAPPPDYKDVF
jgi:hypothetical protein